MYGQNLSNGVIRAFSLSKFLSRFLLDVLSVPPHLNSNISNILINFCPRSVITVMFICFGRVKQNCAAAWEADVA